MHKSGHLPILLMLTLLLAACGFSPMYAQRPDGANPALALAQVDVKPPASRLEQMVRNELLRNVPPAQQGAGAYQLNLTVTESEASLLGLGGVTRQRLIATFSLTEKEGGKILFQGKSFADATFHKLGRQFADERAKEAAQRTAAKILAEDIRTRLAAWFARH